MNRTYISFLVTSVLIGSLLSSCASFREGHLQLPKSWPPEVTQRKNSISLFVTGEAFLNDLRMNVPLGVMQNWQKQIAKAYVASGLFSEVKLGAEGTDLRSEVHVRDFVQYRKALAIISGLTLTLFPATGHDKFVVRARILDKDGQTLQTIEKTETINLWIQFFLIFIMPFNWPPTKPADTLYDLSRTIIMEAHEGGVF